MSMTKKDFQAIAKIINDQVSQNPGQDTGLIARNIALKCVAQDIADLCEEGNPNFKRSTFLVACGLPLQIGGPRGYREHG